MSADSIDRLLAEWEERLRRVDESLLALEAEPTYQMLAPRAQTRAPLEGETRRGVGPAARKGIVATSVQSTASTRPSASRNLCLRR